MMLSNGKLKGHNLAAFISLFARLFLDCLTLEDATVALL
jgi:hypothetical protein